MTTSEVADRAPRRHRAARQRHSGARAPRDPRIGINAFRPGEDDRLSTSTTRPGRARRSCTSCSTGRDVRDRRRDGRCARRDTRVRPAGGAAEGDRGRNDPRPRRNTRPGLPGDRLGRGVAVPPRLDDRLRRAALRRCASTRSATVSSARRTTPASTTTSRASRRSPATAGDETFATSSGRRAVPAVPRAARRTTTSPVRDDPRFEAALSLSTPRRRRARSTSSASA